MACTFQLPPGHTILGDRLGGALDRERLVPEVEVGIWHVDDRVAPRLPAAGLDAGVESEEGDEDGDQSSATMERTELLAGCQGIVVRVGRIWAAVAVGSNIPDVDPTDSCGYSQGWLVECKHRRYDCGWLPVPGRLPTVGVEQEACTLSVHALTYVPESECRYRLRVWVLLLR